MSFETGGNVRLGGQRFSKTANDIFRLPSLDYLTKDVLINFIDRHENEQLPRLQELLNYYLNETAITYRSKKDTTRANNRISHNFARYISTLIQGYVLGKPIVYNHRDEKLLEQLNEFNDYNNEQSHNSNLELNLSIYGRAYELVYMDSESKERIAIIDPRQAFLIYDTTVEGDAVAGVRYYTFTLGDTEKRYVEVYSNQKIYHYEGTSLKDIALTAEEEHYFEGVPLIEYWNNDWRTGDFEPVMDLIDAYDKAQSDTANSMEDFADAYLVLSGQPNTEYGDIQAMKESRVIVLDDPVNDNVKPDAYYLTKTYDVQGEEAYKNRIVNDIHKLSFTPDLSDEKFSSNVSGEAMKYKLFILDQLRVTKERLFKEALMVRLRLIAQMWSIKRKESDIEDIEIVFTPNLPANVKELVEIATTLEGVVSEETQLSLLPMIEDVNAEIERIKTEKEENMRRFQLQSVFQQKAGEDGEVDGDDE